MTDLYDWAQRHHVTPAALGELVAILGEPPPVSVDVQERSEAAAQGEVRLDATAWGGVLWRNNVGAFMDDTGVPVRYGLANDSRRLNQKIKSSDLIGVLPMVVGPQHVGHMVGVFVAVECKRGGWRYTGTKRERAQMAFLNVVRAAGGLAGFACGREDFRRMVTGGGE